MLILGTCDRVAATCEKGAESSRSFNVLSVQLSLHAAAGIQIACLHTNFLTQGDLMAQTKSSSRSRSRSSSKRELINTGRDKRFVRRDSQGQFKESDDVGKSLSQDRRRHAKRTVKSGEGDRGDQKRRSR